MPEPPAEPPTVRVPGNRTTARLSASEDFKLRTLSEIPTLLEKLVYLASLRPEGGAYEHWGMNRTHGWADALVAMADAHTDLFREALSTEVAAIARDLDSCGDRRQLLAHLAEAGVMPANLGGGSERHWQYLLKTLSALASALRAV
jgi:hypothetical protein